MVFGVDNIFEKLSGLPGQEDVLTLFKNQGVTIERIVSHSHSSPSGFWYDQSGDEWVIVLRGRAILEFESGERIEIKDGSYLTIPSHVRHRVQQTDSETIWLAVHSKDIGGT
jgi:cupin 2 domain-containing protein